MREVALVVDEYGNEIFFGETIGECRRYCDEHHITGENGEYIAVGDFDDETASFEMFDYESLPPLDWKTPQSVYNDYVKFGEVYEFKYNK